MKNKYTILVSCFLLILISTSCDDFVAIDRPSSQLSGIVVFEDKSTATAAVTEIYSKLRTSGLFSGAGVGMSTNMGLYADELDYYGIDLEPGIAYTNNLLPESPIVTQCWNESYHQIYCANAIIEGLEKSESILTSDKNPLIGEALFVRAMVHFYLLQIYGEVPYITATNYDLNKQAPRLPAQEVYVQIIADAEKAIDLLPQDYVSAERTRPNKSVANAFLARVYLYNKQWSQAVDAASAVINRSEYVWENEIDNVFLKDAKTTIWQLHTGAPGTNTKEANSFIFNQGPPPLRALSTSLINAFEPNDLRKTHWVRAITNGSATWFHSFKYKQKENTGQSVEYPILFRIAEQYLIRAEALASQGELTAAVQDLNKIRARAGLLNSNATSATAILKAVQQERRVELFTEQGHRFFDLKRTGTLDEVLLTTKPGWNTTDQLWPIPSIELNTNPNLGSQNPGY